MNFVENLFGLAPDGGSGAFEWLLFVAPAFAAAWFAIARWGRRRR